MENNVQMLYADHIASPIGGILLVSDGEAVCAVDYEGYEERLHRLLRERYSSYRIIEKKDERGFSASVRAYLDGNLRAIDAVPVKTGGTKFQRDVWQALREIPVGSTTTYGQLAVKLGAPNGSRAVGLANSQNPIAIIVPCHRVIGSDEKLTGYAGGLERKRWLLEHEDAPLRILRELELPGLVL